MHPDVPMHFNISVCSLPAPHPLLSPGYPMAMTSRRYPMTTDASPLGMSYTVFQCSDVFHVLTLQPSHVPTVPTCQDPSALIGTLSQHFVGTACHSYFLCYSVPYSFLFLLLPSFCVPVPYMWHIVYSRACQQIKGAPGFESRTGGRGGGGFPHALKKIYYLG